MTTTQARATTPGAAPHLDGTTPADGASRPERRRVARDPATEPVGHPDCQFCAIVHNHSPGHVVLRTEHVVAFLDVRPVFPGHVLVVPRRHLETLEDVPDRLLAPLYGTVRDVAAAVRTGLGAGGAFVATNNRVSQSVAHLHVHVVPRTKGDGLRGFFWPRRRYASEEEAAEHAARIAAALPR